MKRTFFCILWFFCAVSTSLATGSTVLFLRRKLPVEIVPSSSSQVTLPEIPTGALKSGLGSVVEAGDARVEIVASFLKRHNSPLDPPEKYAKALVEVADKYGIDYRLLPAIMMQESNLCKVIPPDSHNCSGFGIHSRGTLTFNTYEEGFDRMARELKANYIDKGLTTPEKIMTKYTPSSNGSWAASVNQWIAEMEYNDRSMGKEMKSDADLTQYVEK